MVAEIRLDIEGVAEPGRRAQANDRLTLGVPAMVQGRVPALSEDAMLPGRVPTRAHGKAGQAIAQRQPMISDTTPIAIQSSWLDAAAP